MDRLEYFVRVGGENRESFKRFAFFRAPPLPQTREGIRLAAFERDGERLLVLWIAALPLVKGIGGNQAPALAKRFTKSWLLRGLFCPRIDR